VPEEDWDPVLPAWALRSVHLLEMKSLPGDRFEFRGHPPPGELRLRMPDGPWLPMNPIQFRPGQDDLEIALRPGLVVEGSFVVNEDVDWPRTQFRLLPVVPPQRLEAMVKPGESTVVTLPDGSQVIVETVFDTGGWSTAGPIPQENTQDMNGVVRAQPTAATGGRIDVRWMGVEPGRYRVEYWIEGKSFPLPGNPELDLRFGMPTAHPLLQNVDLR
jgi:hypothetical protein